MRRAGRLPVDANAADFSDEEPLLTPGLVLEDLARATWQRLADGEALQVRQGETAVTDHLLLEMARLRSPAIQVYKTAQDKEDLQGTDWE